MKNHIVGSFLAIWGVVGAQAALAAGGASGAEVLEQEAQRAKELQDLKYQAQLVEQRAKIAKAYQELNGAGGFVPEPIESGGEVFSDGNRPVVPNSNQAVGVPNLKKDKFTLPTLEKINGSVASFHTKQGYAEAKEGGYLPGGYRVLTVSALEGVKLMRKGIIYQVGFDWSKDER